jgi:2-keto-3-deoxy-L-rhamnonate aldolase RhmA
MQARDLRSSLREPRIVLGGSLSFPSPDMVEIMGYSGFDLVCIDTEHGPHAMEADLTNLLRACAVSGMTSLVRITENEPSRILKALDAGAQGIIIPRIKTKDDVQRAVRAAKYPPMGERGSCGNTRATRHSAIPAVEYYPSANRETIVMPIIEEIEAVERIDEVLSVEGVDMIWVGAADLSASMGLENQHKHPDVMAAMDRVCNAAKKRGIPVVGAASLNDPVQMQWWLDRGVNTFILSITRTIFLSFKELMGRASKMPVGT